MRGSMCVSNKFATNTHLMHGDAPPCLHFNITLKKIIEDALINRFIQLLTYSHGIDIMTEPHESLDVFGLLGQATTRKGPQIERYYSNYMLLDISE